jgi:hypothetical protein
MIIPRGLDSFSFFCLPCNELLDLPFNDLLDLSFDELVDR